MSMFSFITISIASVTFLFPNATFFQISIILCYIEFAIYFTEKSNVEKVIMKIKDILDSEKIIN